MVAWEYGVRTIAFPSIGKVSLLWLGAETKAERATLRIEEVLNEKGQKGWELVSVDIQGMGRAVTWICVMKRPKS